MNNEWCHVFGRFHTFIESLRPAPTRCRAVETAAAEVVSCLRGHFRPLDSVLCGDFPDAGLNDHMVIGGYGKGTAVRTSDAVDLVYVLPAGLGRNAEAEADCRSLENEVVSVLAGRFGSATTVPEGAVLIRPTGNGEGSDLAVHVIPCFPYGPTLVDDRRGYLVARPWTAGGRRHINPRAERERLAAADRATGNKATHLVLMLKAWRRVHGVSIRPVALETLVVEFLSLWTYQRFSYLFYDWMVRDFFFWLGYQGGRRVALPGSIDSFTLDDSWTDAARGAHVVAAEGCRLERENRDQGALDLWGRIFGPTFVQAHLTATASPRRLTTSFDRPSARAD